jgi:hypothetical protein
MRSWHRRVHRQTPYLRPCNCNNNTGTVTLNKNHSLRYLCSQPVLLIAVSVLTSPRHFHWVANESNPTSLQTSCGGSQRTTESSINDMREVCTPGSQDKIWIYTEFLHPGSNFELDEIVRLPFLGERLKKTGHLHFSEVNSRRS